MMILDEFVPRYRDGERHVATVISNGTQYNLLITFTKLHDFESETFTMTLYLSITRKEIIEWFFYVITKLEFF